jgi:hypothetical protein
VSVKWQKMCQKRSPWKVRLGVRTLKKVFLFFAPFRKKVFNYAWILFNPTPFLIVFIYSSGFALFQTSVILFLFETLISIFLTVFLAINKFSKSSNIIFRQQQIGRHFEYLHKTFQFCEQITNFSTFNFTFYNFKFMHNTFYIWLRFLT